MCVTHELVRHGHVDQTLRAADIELRPQLIRDRHDPVAEWREALTKLYPRGGITHGIL